MAQIPNWNDTKPAFVDQVFWTSTGTELNPTAGYYTSRSIPLGTYVANSGKRAYRSTPGFNSPRRPNFIPPLGYEAEFTSSSSQGYTATWSLEKRFSVDTLGEDSKEWYTGVNQQTPLTDPSTDVAVIQKLKAKAIRKLLEKLKDSSVNLAQAYAEREETAKTIANTVTTLAKSYSALRRGNFKDAAVALGLASKSSKRAGRKFVTEYKSNVTSGAANGWLALQYGWKPLLDDVHGAATALAKANLAGENGNTVFATASGNAREKFDTRDKITYVIPSDYSGSDVVTRSRTASIVVRAQCRYARSSPPVSDLASLGITNPALLAWELIPYSFVVDWFLPVGNWLSSLDATVGLSFQSGFISTLTKYEATTFWDTGIVRTDGRRTVNRHNIQQVKRDTMDRTRFSSFPEAPAPQFKNPLSFSHVTSAMALIRQTFKR
jgi:hypothetical protein